MGGLPKKKNTLISQGVPGPSQWPLILAMHAGLDPGLVGKLGHGLGSGLLKAVCWVRYWAVSKLGDGLVT
jgi:hypothetical protein